MRLLICAGGTGGGVYPAMSALHALEKNADQVLWVGSQNGIEVELVKRAELNFAAIPAAGVHGVGLKALPGNIIKIIVGVFTSRKILREYKPDVLFFTGGFVAVPMALASGRIPKLLFVPDIEPGMALKFLSKHADQIAVTTDRSRSYFNKDAKTVITGYPIRPDLRKWTRAKSRKNFNLSSDLPVLLFLGGSKGARSINRALYKFLPQLLERFQVIHISGVLDWHEVEAAKANLDQDLLSRYHAFAYLHEEMGAALGSADLVISRSGASTLGEYPFFELPAILVPYPHAWRYQKVNADYLVDHNAAIILENDSLDNKLLQEIENLFDQPKTLLKMRAAMKSLAAPAAAENIANLLLTLSEPQEQKEASR